MSLGAIASLMTEANDMVERMTPGSTVFEPPAPLHFYSHRSGAETNQYCPRRRYLAYHALGTGVNVFPPIYFDIGTAVHAGLAFLMEWSKGGIPEPSADVTLLDHAAAMGSVNAAIRYFRQTPVYATLDPFSQLEQETLIAGLLWAFYYRAWPAFIAAYEVLFVEESSDDEVEFNLFDAPAVLHILSRPDAIVRDRATGEIVAVNWKTINNLTEERRENITSSLQVNLEAYYAERLYAKYLESEYTPDIPKGLKGQALMTWLEADLAWYKAMQPQVAYTQIVYLVKGPRQLMLKDGTEINQETGDSYLDAEKVWRQDSPLCYRYVNLGDTCPKGRSRKSPDEFPPVAWGKRYWKAGNVSYNQLGNDYVKQPVWEIAQIDGGGYPTAVETHVQDLNSGSVFPSTLPDERNRRNPLDEIVVFEAPVYRNAGRQKRFREQFIAGEIRIAHSLTAVAESMAMIVVDDPPGNAGLTPAQYGETLLDKYFPQHLISCRHPTRCEFDGKVCNLPAETYKPAMELIQIVPGGIWQKRQPHHKAEREAFGLKGDTVAE